MLNKDNYVPWSSRIIRYAKSRPNSKMIVDSIENVPYVRRMIATPGEPDLPILVPESFHEQTDEELTETDIKRMDADDQAIQTILLGLLEDVYAAVDSYEIAKEIWECIRQMMKGSDIREQEKKANLFNDGKSSQTRHHSSFNFPTTHKDQSSSGTHLHQSFLINNKYNPQPSLNQNFMQPPMTSLEDINDPNKAINAALILFAKEFQLSAPTNNNQRTSSNPRSRQIAQPVINMGQDRQTQNVGGNSGNQFGQYARQMAQNQQGYNAWKNGIVNQSGTSNVVAPRAEGTGNRNQARCYNCRGLGHIARNCTARPKRRDVAYLQTQLLITQKEEAGIQLQAEEFDFMAAAGDLDEIEEVNANCILMVNLQQASTSGTQHDKAPVYDTDSSAEVYLNNNCYDNEIFNMFTQDEQYTDLLEPIPEPQLVPQNDNHVTSVAPSTVQSGGTVETSFALNEETRAHQETVYHNLLDQVAQGFKYLAPLNQKLESKIVELEFQVVNYEREISHLKTTYKNLFDSIKSNQAHAKLHDLIYENAKLRARRFENTSESIKNTSGTSVTPHVDKPKLSAVTPLSKKLHALMPSHSVPPPIELNVVKHRNVIAPEMFKIIPSQTPKVDLVLNKQASASIRTNPITNSQRHVTIRENVSFDTVTASSTGLVQTAKTRRPWSKGKTRNARVPSASKSSEIKKIICANCKQCLVTANHDACLPSSVNALNSRANKLCDNVPRSANQKRHSTQVVQIFLWCVDSGCSKHMTRNIKLLINFVWKFLGNVRFGNDHIAAILGYGDLKWGNVTITRVYLIEGLGHNLFSVGQFCDADLEVAFRKNTCFIRDLDVLKEYFDSVSITHETSAAKTPQQNGVVERRNRTLVEAVRTMLIFSHAPLFLWAEAIATTCYTQNRSIIHRRFNKTPYKLIQGRKPNISYLHVFGALCYPKNDREDIGKLGAKGDICFFIGYSANSVAYKVYNRRTKKIMETMNITFNELSAMAFEQNSSRPGLQKAPRAIIAAPVAQNLQAPIASMSFQDSAPVPTNSSNTPVSLHNVDTTSQHHAQQQSNLTSLPTASAADNVSNVVVEGDLFVNPFGTPSTESVVNQSPSGIFINQSKYVHEILKKYGLHTCDIVGTPMDIKDKLDLYQIGTPVDATKYRSMIGALMYLTSSRPNIVHDTCDSGFELTGFSYAYYAGCKDTFKSTSAESEYVSLSACCAQVLWMRTQLTDYGYHFEKIPIYYDSKSAIAISCNPVQHFRTKHIVVRYHFIKEHIENGTIELQNQRDLPKDTPIDRIEVLRYDTEKWSKVRMGIMPTKTELILEQTQQVTMEILLEPTSNKLLVGDVGDSIWIELVTLDINLGPE
nr:retrovirus-related Pol polyprotein from transposon TNT 1-94 [Tanacetum cinerariifolium]GEV96103.1 retrovirus-related Pol polyprotein from transposon TNT 1-94 [Tanacetum cinerariifolium]